MSRVSVSGERESTLGVCFCSAPPPSLHYSSSLCHLLFNVHKIRVNSDNKR